VLSAKKDAAPPSANGLTNSSSSAANITATPGPPSNENPQSQKVLPSA
jgi:hypothetical protein